MSYEQILYDVKDQILTITLHRPEKLNAYTAKMQAELIDAFARASADDDVRAIIVTGAGRAFCAGADLSAGAATFDATSNPERAARNAGPVGTVDWSDDRVRDGGGRLTLAIFECLKPVIAAVNGPAVGVGATMQLAMDIRIASNTARFGFVFARRGIVPEAASSLVPAEDRRHLPGARMVLFGPRLRCGRGACAAGSSAAWSSRRNCSPPPTRSRAEIRDNTAPVSVALIRQMMWRLSALDHPMEAHKIDSRGIYARGASADVKEGVVSFLEKRPAKFPEKVSNGHAAVFPVVGGAKLFLIFFTSPFVGNYILD